MNNNNCFAALFTLLSVSVMAQQSPRLSQFNFAQGMYNPAATGSSERLVIGGAFRGQWVGLDGAPSTQLIFAEKAKDRVGLGAFLRNDKAGTLGITDFFAAYSYKLPLNGSTVLRAGLSAGLSNWRNDFSKLRLDDTDDPQFLTNINRWLPNFGAGAQIEHRLGQLGFGVPQLFEYNLNDEVESIAARTFRHYFAQATGNIYLLDERLLLQPQVVLASASMFNGARKAPRNDLGAPNALDLGLGAWIENRFLAGIQWRSVLEKSASSPHSLGLLAGWTSERGVSVSGVYEIPMNPVRRATDASFEIMAKFSLNPREPRVTPPPPANAPKQPLSLPDKQPAPAAVPAPTPTPAPVPPPAPEVPADLRIEGIVFDMTTGLPCEGARLTWTNTCTDDAPAALITTADGRYRIAAKTGCCYTVTAQKDGRKPAI